MKIDIKGLNSGSYYLVKDKLSFNCNDINIQQTKFNNDIIIELDKKSALEIMHTLLDSVNLFDKDNEQLLYIIEERIDE